MKLGLYGLHRGSSADPDVVSRRARRAEDVGFESLWVGDHIALPVEGESDPAEQPRLEALVTLAHLAALTERVRLAVGVIVLPQRQPVLLAKQLTAIDVLSSGRLIVGLGAGYLEPELRALGVSPDERGARTDESIAALKALWDKPTPSFAGRFVSFDGVIQRPRPVQRPHPPIVVGGASKAAFRRAVQHADGWYGWDLDPEQAGRAVAELADAARRHERAGELEITITPPAVPDLDTARRYAEAGVHRLAIQPQSTDGDEIDELIEQVGATLVGRVNPA